MDDVKNKLPDVSRLVINTAFNTKTGEVENKIPNYSGLVTSDCFQYKN